MNLADLVGYAAAPLTTFAFIPQLHRIIKTRSVKDVSLFMYWVMLAGVSLWVVYGVFIYSLPIIIANGVTFLFVSAILMLKLRWK